MVGALAPTQGQMSFALGLILSSSILRVWTNWKALCHMWKPCHL